VSAACARCSPRCVAATAMRRRRSPISTTRRARRCGRSSTA
jgi:hypothetical protein